MYIYGRFLFLLYREFMNTRTPSAQLFRASLGPCGSGP